MPRTKTFFYWTRGQKFHDAEVDNSRKEIAPIPLPLQSLDELEGKICQTTSTPVTLQPRLGDFASSGPSAHVNCGGFLCFGPCCSSPGPAENNKFPHREAWSPQGMGACHLHLLQETCSPLNADKLRSWFTVFLQRGILCASLPRPLSTNHINTGRGQ